MLELAALELAEYYGRDLGDPFGSAARPPEGAPWLETRFLIGRFWPPAG